MGADGCVGVHKAREAQKQGKQGSFRVSQVRNWVPWPGKFPRTSCFGYFRKKWCEWVQMDVDRFRWVRLDVWSRGNAKTRQKEQ